MYRKIMILLGYYETPRGWYKDLSPKSLKVIIFNMFHDSI